jgi:hypothetical protein
VAQHRVQPAGPRRAAGQGQAWAGAAMYRTDTTTLTFSLLLCKLG